MIELKQFGPEGFLGNYSYTLHWDNKLLIIDPINVKNEAFAGYLKRAKESGFEFILTNTHGHPDHIGHNKDILQCYPDCLCWDYSLFKNGEQLFHNGEGGRCFIYRTPGHYPDHVSFKIENNTQEEWILGDTLFHGGVGNCKNGDPVTLYQTVQMLKELVEPQAKLYFSHNYAATNLAFIHSLRMDVPQQIANLLKDCEHDYIVTTWQEELLYNPFLQCDKEGEFVSLRAQRDNF